MIYINMKYDSFTDQHEACGHLILITHRTSVVDSVFRF